MNWTAIKSVFQCAALAAVTYLSVTAAIAVHTFEKHASASLMSLNDTVGKVNTALDRINGPKGTLTQVNDVVRDVRKVVDHSDRLMTRQEQSIDKWDEQISTTLANVNTAVVATTEDENKLTEQTVEVMATTKDSVVAVKDLTIQLDSEVDALHTATVGITDMLPDVKETAKNVKETSINLNGTTKDVSHAVHEYVYPGPWQRVWSYVEGFGLDVAKFFIP